MYQTSMKVVKFIGKVTIFVMMSAICLSIILMEVIAAWILLLGIFVLSVSATKTVPIITLLK